MSSAIAAAFASSSASRTQMALGMEMLKMNADAAASIVQVLESAQDSMQQMVKVSADLGARVDLVI